MKKWVAAFFSIMTASEWLTLLIACCSLVVSWLAYKSAADSSKLQKAVMSLSDLAAQSKRQADATGAEVSVLVNSLDVQRRQTGILQSQASEAQRSAAIAEGQLKTSIAALGMQGAGQISITAVNISNYGSTNERVGVPFQFENVGDYGIRNAEICANIELAQPHSSDKVWAHGFSKDQCFIETLPRGAKEPLLMYLPEFLDGRDYWNLSHELAEIVAVARATFKNPGDKHMQVRDVCYRFFSPPQNATAKACPTPEGRH